MARLVLLLLVALFGVTTASAQSLTPEQLEAVRRGAASLHVPDSGTVVPLHGPPDLPLVEVHIDGSGPYRFLVDLGSNVVIARRSVLEDAGVPASLDREGIDIYVADEMTIGAARFREVWVGAYGLATKTGRSAGAMAARADRLPTETREGKIAGVASENFDLAAIGVLASVTGSGHLWSNPVQ